MKYFVPMVLCALCVTLSFSSPVEKFSQVRIFATQESDFLRITDAGLLIDHANTKPGYYSDAWLSASEIELLKKSGVPFRVLIDDWDEYYASLPTMTDAERQAAIRQSAEQFNVSHSIYGSMGGYLTYSEVAAKLDSMRIEYPNFISAKFSIGTTLEGRNMWVVRITKNPDAPTGRPEVLYHALIHAREPESMETQMYYFYWLFENYGTDPLATYIIENREIYWLPVFNPDGYVYNQSINPNGGGNWRCNRHFTTGTCGPVDLNRNFGIYQYWNSSNGGSSTNQCSGGMGTYRGTAPFSELETQAVMNFVNSRNFNAVFGAHTYGNYLIKPWAWSDPSPTPDDYKFNQFLADMKASNPVYTTGTPLQTVGYAVRGSSDDWYYNDSAHVGHNIFAITPETGTSFWPAQNQIIPLAEGMLFNNQYMSLIAGSFVNPTARTFDQETYVPGESGTFKVAFRNKGAIDADPITVRLTTTSPAISIPTTEFTYPSLASFAADSALFNFTISATVPNNTAIPTLLAITEDTAIIYSAPAYVLIGSGAIVFNDTANVFSNWTTNGTWAVTNSQFHTAPSSFTDSPSGNYGNNADNSMTLAASIDASATPALKVSFYHRYSTASGYDYCRFEVSSDNGATWQPVSSYDGSQSTWTQQEFDISNFANGSSQVKIRFRLTSDVSVTSDGWYVDDIRIRGYAMPPDTGLLVRPAGFSFTGTVGRIFQDSLVINNFTQDTVTISLAESTLTTPVPQVLATGATRALKIADIVQRLRPAFANAHLSQLLFKRHQSDSPLEPDAFATIITDERGEGSFGAVDVYRVDYQLRTGPLGTYHDFRIVTGLLPDTNVVGFLSVDTDQDFGTGSFPTPLGLGLTSRDLGSEREILIDASGIIIDSLTGFGRIPAGIVINTANDSLIGLPFLLTVTRDSVLSISTNSVLGGIREEWLGDIDPNFNIGAAFSHLANDANPMPDFAPSVAHGNVGAEAGTSWLSESTTHVTLLSGESAVIPVRGLAARNAGTYESSIAFLPSGRPGTSLPVVMTILAAPAPHIATTPLMLVDTVAVGDSSSLVLHVSNTGGGQLFYGIVDTAQTPWLAFSSAGGTLDSGQTVEIAVTLNATGLVVDSTYQAQLYVVSNDPSNNAFPIGVTLRTDRPTDVDENEQVPAQYALYQNYPNPFNPETNISFDLPQASFVSIKLYNVIGQEVATIAHQELRAGTYTYRVQTSEFGLASGVYFYRMKAGEFTQTRKMIMLR